MAWVFTQAIVVYKDMSDEYPLVSAIMLAGNNPIEHVKKAIRCFQSQTYPYKELIIVNNAKTQLEASNFNIQAEPNVFIIDTPNKLPSGLARNYGISGANGTILAQFDADYWYAPERLEAQIATMADQAAHVCMLTKTLAYSYCSGIASYQNNNKNTIVNTMVFIRPSDIDYTYNEKNEELGILNKFAKAGRKIITMDKPELACKLYTGDGCDIRLNSDTKHLVSSDHLKTLTTIPGLLDDLVL